MNEAPQESIVILIVQSRKQITRVRSQDDRDSERWNQDPAECVRLPLPSLEMQKHNEFTSQNLLSGTLALPCIRYRICPRERNLKIK